MGYVLNFAVMTKLQLLNVLSSRVLYSGYLFEECLIFCGHIQWGRKSNSVMRFFLISAKSPQSPSTSLSYLTILVT